MKDAARDLLHFAEGLLLPVAVASLLAFAASAGPAHDRFANAPAYLRPAQRGVMTIPLLTAGQRVPYTGGKSGETYLFPGTPDGMGAHATGRTLTLFVNHEFGSSAGGASGAVSGGARVSELTLHVPEQVTNTGAPLVVSARPAIRALHAGEKGVPVPHRTRRLTKLCAGTMAGPADGFDRWMYFCCEEEEDATAFDRRGGSAFAVLGGHAYQLPRVGHAQWESIVPLRGTDARTTVLLAFEDAEARGDGLTSQLYMYVGRKQPRAKDALVRNGLRGGRLYTFVADRGAASESTITRAGEWLHGTWVPVDASLTAAGLDSATRAVNAMRFVRIEDGAADPLHAGRVYFATTGDSRSVNKTGRVYLLVLDPRAPLEGATVTIVLDGSEGVFCPDNVAVNKRGELAICEDPTQDLTKAGLKRDASVWIYDLRSRALHRVAEMDQEAAIKHLRTTGEPDSVDVARTHRGSWETSGIIDAEQWAGLGSWFVNVQAHTMRVQPEAETVRGGQVLLLRVGR